MSAEQIVLEEREVKDASGETMGWVRHVVDRKTLTTKVKDLFPEGSYPAQFAEMTLIAYIKQDAEDKLGWKRHKPKLRAEGFDV